MRGDADLTGVGLILKIYFYASVAGFAGRHYFEKRRLLIGHSRHHDRFRRYAQPLECLGNRSGPFIGYTEIGQLMAYLIEISRAAAGMSDDMYPATPRSITIVNLSDDLQIAATDTGRSIRKQDCCDRRRCGLVGLRCFDCGGRQYRPLRQAYLIGETGREPIGVKEPPILLSWRRGLAVSRPSYRRIYRRRKLRNAKLPWGICIGRRNTTAGNNWRRWRWHR